MIKRRSRVTNQLHGKWPLHFGVVGKMTEQPSILVGVARGTLVVHKEQL